MVTRSQPQQKSNGEQSMRKVVLSRTIHVAPCAETIVLSASTASSTGTQQDGRKQLDSTQNCSITAARSRSDLDRDVNNVEEGDEIGQLTSQLVDEENNKAASSRRSKRQKNGVTRHRHCWISREDEFDSLPQPENNSSIASSYKCSVIVVADATGSVTNTTASAETQERAASASSTSGEMGDEERSKATVVRGLLSTAGFVWLPPMCLPVSTFPVDNLKDCALACGRHLNRRNALADPLTLPLTQRRKEELISEAQNRQKSVARRISQFFLRSSPSECEIDLI